MPTVKESPQGHCLSSIQNASDFLGVKLDLNDWLLDGDIVHVICHKELTGRPLERIPFDKQFCPEAVVSIDQFSVSDMESYLTGLSAWQQAFSTELSEDNCLKLFKQVFSSLSVTSSVFYNISSTVTPRYVIPDFLAGKVDVLEQELTRARSSLVSELKNPNILKLVLSNAINRLVDDSLSGFAQRFGSYMPDSYFRSIEEDVRNTVSCDRSYRLAVPSDDFEYKLDSWDEYTRWVFKPFLDVPGDSENSKLMRMPSILVTYADSLSANFFKREIADISNGTALLEGTDTEEVIEITLSLYADNNKSSSSTLEECLQRARLLV